MTEDLATFGFASDKLLGANGVDGNKAINSNAKKHPNQCEEILPPDQQLLNVVATRFQQKKRIYSRIGGMDLLALNPCERLPIYDHSVMAQYGIEQQQQPQQSSQVPHIFGIAADALKSILEKNSNRGKAAILFGGEAGSGKTENLFNALRCLGFFEEQRMAKQKDVNTSECHKIDIELANALEQVLNAFGGAKTLKNDGATRHGYAMELHYSGSVLVGISVESMVPLELCRLLQQKKGERNFGCFYQICAGIGPEQREKLGLKSANNYFYLNQGKCQGLDVKKEAEKFMHLCGTLKRIGFSDHQQELIFRLLAAILHIGNLFFKAQKSSVENGHENGDMNEEGEEYAELANEGELRWIAHLLDVDFGQLKNIFTHNSQGARLDVDSALDRRDWFAKCIYSELFRWLLSRISMFTRTPMMGMGMGTGNIGEDGGNDKAPNGGKIVLVDMPGYERYNNNGYEEFCVNLVSEQMERFFQDKQFSKFRDEELQNDRPELSELSWPNNERVLDMLTKRPMGILPLLDDECKFPKGSDETFLQHCNINHLDKPNYAKARLKGRLEMGIRQHFGLAFYNIEGFLQRNRHMQLAAFFQILARSKDAAVAAIFSPIAERHREDKWIYGATECLKGVQKLCQNLSGANLHFVRCVRINQERIAGKWDPTAVGRQFKALDLLEHCHAVRLAFPHKYSLTEFVKEFQSLLPEEVIRGQSIRHIAKDVLIAQGIRYEHDYVIGTEHIFLRDAIHGQLRQMHIFTKNFAAIIIQRNVRKVLARRAYLLKKAAIVQLQAGFRGWKGRKRIAEIRERLNWMSKYDNRQEEMTKNRKFGQNGIRKEEDNKKPKKMCEDALRNFPAELREAIENAIENCDQKEHSGFKKCSKYLALPKMNKKTPIVPQISLEKFAADHFKTIILGCRREPIETPFLAKENEEEFGQSLAMFKLILHYQYAPEGTNPAQMAILAKYIVQQAIDCPALRDELFAQLLNQSHNCQCGLANSRLWTLMLTAVHSFPPSGLTFPVLYNYFHAQPSALSQMLIGGLLKVSTLPETAPTNRTFTPTAIEQIAFEQRQPAVLCVQFADGECMDLEVNPWTTTDELVQMALRQRGIGDEFGWGLQIVEESNGQRQQTELAGSQFPFDAIAQLENAGNGQLSKPNEMAPFAFMESAINSAQKVQTANGRNGQMEGQQTLSNWTTPMGPNGHEQNGANYGQRSEMRNPFEQKPPPPPSSNGTFSTSNGINKILSNSSFEQQQFYRPKFMAAPSNGGGQQSYGLQRNGQMGQTNGHQQSRAYLAGSQFSPLSALPFVRQRSDAGASGLQLRRQANPNCMSRITEKDDETESTVSMQQRGANNHTNNGTNTIGRIRNMPIPGDDQNVDRFLDNVFEEALPPADYLDDGEEDQPQHVEEEEKAKFDRAIVGRLAASIKGGDFYEPQIVAQPRPTIGGGGPYGHWPRRQNPLFNPTTENSAQQQQQFYGAGHQNPMDTPINRHQQQRSPPRRYVYRPGGDILLDNGNQQIPLNRQPLPPLPLPPQSAEQQYHQVQQPYETIDSISHQQQQQQNYDDRTSQSKGYFGPKEEEYSGSAKFGTNGQGNEEQFQSLRRPIAAATSAGGGGLRRFVIGHGTNGQWPNSTHPPPPPSCRENAVASIDQPLSIKSPQLQRQNMYNGQNVELASNNNNKYHEIGAYPSDNGGKVDHGINIGGGKQHCETRRLQPGDLEVYGQILGHHQSAPSDVQNDVEQAESPDVGANANEWVAESEATLDALFNADGTNPSNGNFAFTGQNIYSASVRPKSNCGSDVGFDPNGNKDKAKAKRQRPGLAYANQPFQLVIRKQIFLPEEVIDDALEIDMIFGQIIRDCRQQKCQMRIRKYEKDSINQLLRSYNVPPAVLNTPDKIGTNIKLELIGIVRKWPLYFCRLYPCIEERPNGNRIPLFLGISETGLRLIAITIGGSRNPLLTPMEELQQQQQMTIQDHFEFSDLSDLLLENGGNGLRLITRQHIGILLTGSNMAEAKNCIQQYLGIGAKRRQFVIAAADYSTNEPSVLSFEAGDYIQLLDKPDSEPPQSAGTWFYGRLDGRFGWIPAEYVLEAGAQEEQLYSASCNGMSMSENGAFSSLPIAESAITNGTNAIPLVLEPLFANLDASMLFLPDNLGVERYTMVEFAVQYFRRPKGNSGTGKNSKEFFMGNWSWKEVTDRIKFTDKPIGHSLLRLESHEADKVGQQTFLCIMRFMGDEPLKRNQSFTDCVYELLSLCHVYELIRDEVYCQLLKQCTANRSEKSKESGFRGWRLLSILSAYFPCSETLKPYLVKYLGDVAFDHRRTYNALAKLCLFNLAQTYRYGGRRLILGGAEVEAIANGRSVRRQFYNLPGGYRRQICTRSVTVAEEIVQALCLEMNIRGQVEQQEFTLCYLLEKDNSVCTLLNDEYVMDVCTDLEAKGEEYMLILMRSVWLHPLRRDNELYTDALFFQLMPNYLAGLYTTLRADGSATAAILDDVGTLGALLLISDPYQHPVNIDAIAPANLATFVPKTILKLTGHSIEQWAQRIRAKMDELGAQNEHWHSPHGARQRFLEIVERWPLFGAAFYFVKRVFTGKELGASGENLIDQNCVFAVNKFGVRILANETHQIQGEFALDEIREMAKYSVSEANYLEIRLSILGAQKHGAQVVTIETDLGNEISRLIGHYIFLSSTAKNQQ